MPLIHVFCSVNIFDVHHLNCLCPQIDVVLKCNDFVIVSLSSNCSQYLPFSLQFDFPVSVIVLYALSWMFLTCCPWKLLYADDIMIAAESLEELLLKVKIWKLYCEERPACQHLKDKKSGV